MSWKRGRPIRPKRTPKGDYPVGYARTPVHARYKPGQSGNRRGRPLGSKNRVPGHIDGFRWRAIVTREAERIVTVQTTSGVRKITTAEAVMRSITVSALKGQQRSQRLFAELVAEEERARREETRETFSRWAEYKQQWERTGRKPEQLPDPDDVILNFTTGEVTFAGPLFKGEVPAWERWRAVRSLIVKELGMLRDWLSKKSSLRLNKEITGLLAHLIAAAEETLACIGIALSGSRAAMALLQRLPIPEVQGKPLKKRGRRDFTFAVVNRAIADQVAVERGKH